MSYKFYEKLAMEHKKLKNYLSGFGVELLRL
jgi:hypothetical protein